MCDIYQQECWCKEVSVDMHLSDFATPREDISISCPKCDVWIVGEGPSAVWWISRLCKPVRIFFGSDVAVENWKGNHPNEDSMLLVGI